MVSSNSDQSSLDTYRVFITWLEGQPNKRVFDGLMSVGSFGPLSPVFSDHSSGRAVLHWSMAWDVAAYRVMGEVEYNMAGR